MTAEEEKQVAEYDEPWKDALDHAPDLFLQLFYPEIVAAIDWREDWHSLGEELRRQFAQDTGAARRADLIFHFCKSTGDPLYVHIEVQCYHDAGLG